MANRAGTSALLPPCRASASTPCDGGGRRGGLPPSDGRGIARYGRCSGEPATTPPPPPPVSSLAPPPGAALGTATRGGARRAIADAARDRCATRWRRRRADSSSANACSGSVDARPEGGGCWVPSSSPALPVPSPGEGPGVVLAGRDTPAPLRGAASESSALSGTPPRLPMLSDTKSSIVISKSCVCRHGNVSHVVCVYSDATQLQVNRNTHSHTHTQRTIKSASDGVGFTVWDTSSKYAPRSKPTTLACIKSDKDGCFARPPLRRSMLRRAPRPPLWSRAKGVRAEPSLRLLALDRGESMPSLSSPGECDAWLSVSPSESSLLDVECVSLPPLMNQPRPCLGVSHGTSSTCSHNLARTCGYPPRHR